MSMSTTADALLQNLERKGKLIFPGPQHDTMLSDMSLTAVLRPLDRGDLTMDRCRLRLIESHRHHKFGFGRIYLKQIVVNELCDEWNNLN